MAVNDRVRKVPWNYCRRVWMFGSTWVTTCSKPSNSIEQFQNVDLLPGFGSEALPIQMTKMYTEYCRSSSGFLTARHGTGPRNSREAPSKRFYDPHKKTAWNICIFCSLGWHLTSWILSSLVGPWRKCVETLAKRQFNWGIYAINSVQCTNCFQKLYIITSNTVSVIYE